MLYVFLIIYMYIIYTFIYIWYIRLSQMTCRGISGFWCLWLMICRDTFCNVLVVFILLGSCQPKIWPVLRKVLVPDEFCPILLHAWYMDAQQWYSWRNPGRMIQNVSCTSHYMFWKCFFHHVLCDLLGPQEWSWCRLCSAYVVAVYPYVRVCGWPIPLCRLCFF